MIGIISRTEGKGSGAEMVLCHLLNHWDKNYPLLIITALGSSVAQTAKSNGIEVLELSFVPERIWPNLKLIEKHLKCLKQIRILHAWNSKSFELGWYISKRLGVKLTCTMHDHPGAYYYTPRKLWLLKTIANASSGLIAVSNKLAEVCKAYQYRTSITVIQNGLPEVVRIEKSPASEKFTIGFLGMNSHVKGFETVANWINNTKNDENIEWLLYGNVCKEYDPIVRKLKDEGINNFRIMGQQDPEFIFKQIKLLVSTSTFFDCFPTVLLEASRAGIPAIASSNGGASEIIGHGHTGFIFDPATPDEGLQHLKALVDSKDIWKKVSQAARRRFIQNFQIDKMVSQYNEFWIKNIKPGS